MHADEDDDKAYEERDGVYRVIGVDALEQDEGGDYGGRREADIVEGIDSG